MNMPNNIEIGKVFTIKKGNHSEDYKHIVYGGNSIEKTWESAYDHT